MTTSSHKYAVVPADATPDYWNGWWESIPTGPKVDTGWAGEWHAREAAPVHGAFVLRSLRTGRDAELDAEILAGRLLSGLYRCTTFDTFDDALAEAYAWAGIPGVGQLGDAVPDPDPASDDVPNLADPTNLSSAAVAHRYHNGLGIWNPAPTDDDDRDHAEERYNAHILDDETDDDDDPSGSVSGGSPCDHTNTHVIVDRRRVCVDCGTETTADDEPFAFETLATVTSPAGTWTIRRYETGEIGVRLTTPDGDERVYQRTEFSAVAPNGAQPVPWTYDTALTHVYNEVHPNAEPIAWRPIANDEELVWL